MAKRFMPINYWCRTPCHNSLISTDSQKDFRNYNTIIVSFKLLLDDTTVFFKQVLQSRCLDVVLAQMDDEQYVCVYLVCDVFALYDDVIQPGL